MHISSSQFCRTSWFAVVVLKATINVCRYDGYNQALETAAAKITDTASDLCKPVLPPSPSKQSDKAAGTTKDNFKVGMKVQPHARMLLHSACTACPCILTASPDLIGYLGQDLSALVHQSRACTAFSMQAAGSHIFIAAESIDAAVCSKQGSAEWLAASGSLQPKVNIPDSTGSY